MKRRIPVWVLLAAVMWWGSLYVAFRLSYGAGIVWAVEHPDTADALYRRFTP